MKKSDKVSEMMKEKVDFSILKQPGYYLNLHEKVAHELAEEIECKKDKDYWVVSWESQVEAMNYFNEHGFEKTLGYMLELRKENKNAN